MERSEKKDNLLIEGIDEGRQTKEDIMPRVEKKKYALTRRDKFKIAVAIILLIYGFLFLLNNRYENISGGIVLDKWRGKFVELDIKYQK